MDSHDGDALVECVAMSELFYLLCGHSLADFSLQTDIMAKGKNRNRPENRSAVPPGQQYAPTWGYWLTSHALIHGMFVGYITGVWWLGLAEFVAHWIIDFGKCENWYGLHVDQGLHVSCKILWWIL